MTDSVIFYEKPGCMGAAVQKRFLADSGLQLDVRDLLTHAWTEAELRRFFLGKDIQDCFNSSAPDVKNGNVVPANLQEHQALAMMLENPILIRRPLMQYLEKRQCGFESGAVFEALGVNPGNTEELDGCVHQRSVSGVGN